MDEHEKLTLQTNLARDRAENMLDRLREMYEQAKADIAAGQRPDLSPEQIEAGDLAMQKAIASAERMVRNLNDALAMAEAGFEDDEAGEADDETADDADSDAD